MPPVVGIVELRAKIMQAVEANSQPTRTIVGIAGAPAAGKSTVAQALAAALSAPVVPMDGFHLSDRLLTQAGLRGRKGAPETFDVHGFEALLQQLGTRDHTVYCPNFDRARSGDSIGSDIRVEPGDDVVLVEGNYLLLDEPNWSAIRQHLTLSVFVEIPQLVRLKRLAMRHVTGGRPLKETWQFIRASDEPNARRIAASKPRADLVLDPSLP